MSEKIMSWEWLYHMKKIIIIITMKMILRTFKD